MIQLLLPILVAILYPVKACSQQNILSNPIQVRNGWPSVAKRVERGLPVHIAYLGGSITYAKDGWREQSLQGLQKLYPRTSFTHTNAGVGGTGSDLALFRLQNDVLRYKPNLVLIEFAVNDFGKKSEHIQEFLEGIIANIKQHNKHTDIGLVYTVQGSMLPSLEKGELPGSIAAMEEVTARRCLPSVFLADSVMKQYRLGKLVFQGQQPFSGDTIVFSKDNVHPFAQTGHKLYAATFLLAAKMILNEKGRPTCQPQKQPPTTAFPTATIISLSHLRPSGNWKMITIEKDTLFQKLVRRFDTVYAASDPAATIRFTFQGTRFGLYDVIGPGSGAYHINIDGRDTVVNRFDRFCTYWRTHYILLPELPEGIHYVTISPYGGTLDKESIMKKTFTEEERKLYETKAVYPGQLLLAGHIIKEKPGGQ